MKAVLVAGAAGGIGQAIVRALLLADDTRVFAQSRSRERLDRLRDRLEPAVRDRLTPIVGNAGDFDGAAEIAAGVEAAGGIDAAIAILGRGFWEGGPLLDLAPDEWRAVLDEMLTAHFAFARAIIPLVAQRRNGLYLLLGGSAAFEPARDAGLMSIAAAGQAMLTRVLERERGLTGPRVLELVVEGDVATPESEHRADPNWISADEVGGVVAELVQYGDTTWQPKRVSDPLLVMQRMR